MARVSRALPGAGARAGIARGAVAVLLVGFAGGVAGAVVTLVLATVEHLTYGYRSGTFLDGVVRAEPWLRVVALGAAGLIGGFGWWALRRWGRAAVSIEHAVAGDRMPGFTTVTNVLLQLVIVGMGASIGREVAPRQLGALAAERIAGAFGLVRRRRSILIACGAGAGLAAVYNVPLGGALFTIEVLLADWSLAVVLPAIVTAGIATLVGRVVVPASALYVVPHEAVSPSLLACSVVVGPVVGLTAVSFSALTQWLRARRPTGWRLALVMPVVFLGVGLLGAVLPEILGNGRALGQVAFAGTLPLGLLIVLGIGKYVATAATIGSGAEGGTLTPSLAMGAAFGAAIAGLWSAAWPGAPVSSCAVVAAAAFLSVTMKAPITAAVLALEFTGADVSLTLPVLLAVSGATAVRLLAGRDRSLRRRGGDEPDA